ncbi:addiction module antidote protein [Xanthomonas citri pv. malvacearum]|uniref:Addiction module antidote protein n=2 Tax=Xanthomonas citri TaxID=346 RepID=A0AA44YYS5_XANCM|nr:addiction module antidote protein [Xanthomonas citri]ASN01456.1 transcriptional regulator [Xanthomonas citri pv. malvacearum]ASN09419.1 transcriptional regulator [Xanthomonas citri pv. malvacearum]ASY86747.1 putative addiction module antidote protein [Xanthomonas citri pv. malvacearum]MCC4631591.1 putative addiction module antidote protein [Xanthomonas citri]NMI15888.1 putative addiction module antidote protein [Xanthomonas citri]
MNTIFIGGSRHVSRLPAEIKHRLDNVINSGHQVIVGDANGADKAVQKYFSDAAYNKVTVFCSGDSFRNNLGHWTTRKVDAPKSLKGFQFYAAKDREMAREADFGLMIWDGKSPGTVLNVLRLVRAGKIAVLFSVPDKRAINIKTQTDWESFLSHCSDELRHDLHERATPDEWQSGQQQSLLDSNQETRPATEAEQPQPSATGPSEDELANSLDAALAAADPAAVVNALGDLAKMRGMSNVAKETGLARESLYRALSSGGNPEFATVLKVLSSLGLRLSATHAR